VLVGGEPGIGKTTLAGVFARAAHAEGSVVLYGRCDEDLGIPYQPWAEAIGHLMEHAPPGVLDEVLAAHGADLARLGPGLADLGEGGGGSADPETARYLLFGAVLRVLQAAGAEHPVVLVIDDLQWADTPTLQLLRQLVAWDQPLAVVVVATFRESDVGAEDPLAEVLAWLHREPGVARIGLRGLGDDDLLALMEAGAGHAVDAEGLALRDALAAETDGNPFFVGELLRHLIETGVVYQDGDGRWTVRGDLRERGQPVSVRDVIGRRVARLGGEAVRILSMAAVIGRDFDLGALAAASDTGEDALLDVLDAAVAATLVVNVAADRYSFVHALVEHALYDGLTPSRRARGHRRVAEAIEAACGPDPGARVGELAYHWAQASDAAKAVAYARAAGDRALAHLAPAEALRWYDQALSLLDHQPDDQRLRAALLAGVGDAQRQTGDPSFGNTLLAAARMAQRVGDTSTLVAATLANNRGFASAAMQVDSDRVAIIHAALVAVGDDDSTARARLLSLLALEHMYDDDHHARKRIADEGLAIARRLGDPATLLDVLLRRPVTITDPDTVAERLADTAEAEAVADMLGDPIGCFWSAVGRMTPAIASADLAEFTRCVAKQTALADRIGQPTLRWFSTVYQSAAALLSGDAQRAEALAELSLQIGTDTGQPDASSWYDGLMQPIRWHLGRNSGQVDVAEAVAAEHPGFPMIRGALARIYADVGRDGDARRLVAAETAIGFPPPRDWMQLGCLIYWADAAALVGDAAAAEMLYERLAPWPSQVFFIGIAVFGALAHYLGHLATVLGRYQLAEAHFTQALAIHQRLHAPFHLARTHLEWGRMLVARNQPRDADAARVHLESARDLARRYGCALVEQRATGALAGL